MIRKLVSSYRSVAITLLICLCSRVCFADTVTRIAGNQGEDASTGTTDWLDPGNITANDGLFAQTNLFNQDSYYLYGFDFGFNIPLNATIDAILVEYFAQSTNGVARTRFLYIVKGGVVQTGATQGDSGNSYDTSPGSLRASLNNDLWGLAWTPADINAAGFGAALSVTDDFQGGDDGFIDYIQITVTYTPAPAVSVKTSMRGVDISGGPLTIN